MVAQIADKCDHPNAAKLFIRWICGEADHTGEGLEPLSLIHICMDVAAWMAQTAEQWREVAGE